jgi:hypothetical protein
MNLAKNNAGSRLQKEKTPEKYLWSFLIGCRGTEFYTP